MSELGRRVFDRLRPTALTMHHVQHPDRLRSNLGVSGDLPSEQDCFACVVLLLPPASASSVHYPSKPRVLSTTPSQARSCTALPGQSPRTAPSPLRGMRPIVHRSFAQNPRGLLGPFVEHSGHCSARACRAMFAPLPVADRFVRHVDAKRQIHLSHSSPVSYAASIPRHFSDCLRIVSCRCKAKSLSVVLSSVAWSARSRGQLCGCRYKSEHPVCSFSRHLADSHGSRVDRHRPCLVPEV